jgi:hypothetical protein
MQSDVEIISCDTNDSIICIEPPNETTTQASESRQNNATRFKMLFEETIIEDETSVVNIENPLIDDYSINSNKENCLEETVFEDDKIDSDNIYNKNYIQSTFHGFKLCLNLKHDFALV